MLVYVCVHCVSECIVCVRVCVVLGVCVHACAHVCGYFDGEDAWVSACLENERACNISPWDLWAECYAPKILFIVVIIFPLRL